MSLAEPAIKPQAEPRGGDTEIETWVDLLGGLTADHPRPWIALGNLESRMLRDALDAIALVAPIYVTGLARSGSTILLELLSRHDQLATHRYRDFPPVLAPYVWNWFVDRATSRPPAARERAHKDRIAVTPESPEAFEEVVWMAFFPGLHGPARSSVLDRHTANPAFEAFYRDHLRKMLMIRGGRRYLAKGNYNVTRLQYLLKLFPDARFVVPIRDPVWHIASLMKQHALFCREGRRDPRVVRHMSRCGHFEFGLDRRVVNVGDDAAAAQIAELWHAGREVEGWAAYWSLIYGHLAERLGADPALRAATLIVRYEDVCAAPADRLAEILAHCRLEAGDLPALAEATIQAPDYYEPAFTPAERELIAARTGNTAALFGYSG